MTPDRLKQRLLLAREHYGKREFDKAHALLREVLEHEDKFADVHDMLGVIAHTRGDFAAAEGHFERALAINPSYTEAALNLAVTYNDRGSYEEAREIYRRIKSRREGGVHGLDPFVRGKLANMHAELGQAYADSGMPREAIGEYEKAVALCPDFADLRTKLGLLLRESGEVGRAREHYEAAVASRPSYAPARIQLGVTLLALGDADGAEREWQRVLELDPDDARSKMYLRTLRLQRESGKFSSAPPPDRDPPS